MKEKLSVVFLSLCTTAAFAIPGEYEIQVMAEEICTGFGNKSVEAFKARQARIPKSKIMNKYADKVSGDSLDARVTRQVIDFGYDEATSTKQAGMHGWAICKDAVAKMER